MSLLSPRLIAFFTVAQCKTVHGAARQIHITQTAVTQRIRALERSLKTTLFIRTKKGMNLTLEGEVLLRYCQNIKNLEGEVLAKLQGLDEELEIELTILSPTSLMRSRIIPKIIPILHKYKNLLINFKLADQEKRHLQLKSGLCDFAILNKETITQEMRYKELMPEEYVLVCSYAWANRDLEEIIQNERIIDFNHDDLFTFNYLQKYGFKCPNRNRYFANNTNNLAQLVSAELGYTVLSKEFALPYVRDKQLCILNEGKALEIEHYLAWFERPEPPKYFSEIIDAIK
ncbi:LysR family transcriptional regulator (plasmid) [Legionella adelaidensis]|uniref:LysR family transcriptional regulator n=1 Tax=Legionella adelaidensis TaxID=45056 RepID=A0A0W0R106_9GAMM|nr:LysR family transcriptional regulator [Legionella adelaidensis]KTC64744.1 LysR family transcriptional regulator [Legionella adelaidensis]VEH81290.1 LysR family transcriptional regulator [Legionella adelaidensis]